MRRNLRVGMAAGAVAVTAAACGGAPAGAAGNSGSDAVSTSGPHKVTITSPAPSANVSAPLTVKFSTSVPIGPVSSGKDHVHVFVDGKTNEYTVVTSSPYVLKNIPNGKHTIDVTLQHADHSPDGASAQVSVNVTSGGSTVPPPANHGLGGSGGSGGSGEYGGSGGSGGYGGSGGSGGYGY